jgi:hypothetical protein
MCITTLTEFLTFSIALFLLFKTDNVWGTALCLRPQVEPTQLGPTDRSSPYLRTPAPTQGRLHKPSTAQIIRES